MRSTRAIIHTSYLKYNYFNIRKKVKNSKVMAVVKADAYGHGMIECVKSLELLGSRKPEYYGVALVEEAIELRKAGITKSPVLCFAPFDSMDISAYSKFNIIPTFCTKFHLRYAMKYSGRKKIKVHVNIDTGMGRLGVKYDEAIEFIKKLSRINTVIIDGIYTHFATSDEKNKTFANLQLKRFKKIIGGLKSSGITYGIIHAANSGAILDMPDAYFDMVRPGISLYGYYPSLETSGSIKLKPVMSLVSKVETVKELLKGESVSYGRKYFAKQKTKVITVPIGYADGINRELTNNFSAIINGKKYPQVGRVTMDRILFEIGNENVKIGNTVYLIGGNNKLRITAWDWASALSTIPYEITCGVSKRIPRIYN